MRGLLTKARTFMRSPADALQAARAIAACTGIAFSGLVHAEPIVLHCKAGDRDPQVFKIDPVAGTWHEWRDKYGWGGKICDRQPLVRGDRSDSCDYLPLYFQWLQVWGDVITNTRIDRSDGSVVISTTYKLHPELNETFRGACSVGKEPELPHAIF